LPLLRRIGSVCCIINMGSVCSLIGHKFIPEAYITVKGVKSRLTKSVAVRHVKDNIRANILSAAHFPTVRHLTASR